MAEEEVVLVSPAEPIDGSPLPSPDNKRKLDDLDSLTTEPRRNQLSANSNDEPDGSEVPVTGGDADLPDVKRARLDGNPEDLAAVNGYNEKVADESSEENLKLPITIEISESVEGEPLLKEIQDTEEAQQTTTGNQTVEISTQNDGQVPFSEETEQPHAEIPQQEDDYVVEKQQKEPTSEHETISRRIEVPNNKVGVLIGKAGDTIRYLQYNSGAKIQIMRDAEADLHSVTRPVELIGSLQSINKAEKLIKEVIAEADAGGSPSLVARGLASAQNAGVAEQVLIQVPTEKVGLIIGRGGETIKGLQTRSGARIQLIPEGDESKERTVRVTGGKKQIEIAKEMINEVMNQPMKPQSFLGGYNQQAYRPHEPLGPAHWRPRGPHSSQQTAYDYQQRGPHYGGNFPLPQQAPRSSYGSGWEQRPPPTMQGALSQGGGYDYYGAQGGYGSNHPVSNPHSTSIPSNAPGHSNPAMGPPSHGNYNYGQQGPEYGQPNPYSQMGPSHQSYGHGYVEPKYENQSQIPYGGHGGTQTVYPQGGQPGYAPQQLYGKPLSYGIPSQGPPPQSYGPHRASQPGDMPYQGHLPSGQSYGQNMPTQQQYSHPSTGPMQQTYPPHGSTPATDGYNQPPASGSGYPQQAAHFVPGYGQPGGQVGYAQVAPTASYSSYPASQPGYPEQTAQNNAAYNQAPQDPNYSTGPGPTYSAPQSAQPGYTQPVQTQPGYDQSAPHATGYGGVAGSGPTGHVKSLSPQSGYPQYDSSQMYMAPR